MYDELIELLAEYELDPLGFAQNMFPWGEPGELEHEALEQWQYETLDYIGQELRAGRNVVRVSTATGHGVGKSALASILTQWAHTTFPGTRGVVTANTENQLKTKTWVEINKWHRLCLAKDLFEVTATALFARDPETAKEWRIDVVPWSEKNTEAFAGLHNKGKRIFILLDEASAIPDVIHEVIEGALTDSDTQIIVVMFGNPTKNSGRFFETRPGGKFGKRWRFSSLDSRSVRRTNKELIEQWAEDYGEDSDFFRVRVKGEFPRADAISFISYEQAFLATKRELPEFNSQPMVLGVDVARFGDDKSVILPRRGRDARSYPAEVFQGLDTVQLAHRVREAIARYNPEAVFVDGTGIGGGVVDNLNNMSLPCLIHEVTFSGKPTGLNEESYANVRAEIWGEMRRWLASGCIPENVPKLEQSCIDDLTGPMYMFVGDKSAIQLETKRDMKSRGVKSPDWADALACTFALKIVPVERDRFGRLIEEKENRSVLDHNPFEDV